MIEFCPRCGNKNEKNYKFCPNCGNPLTSRRKAEEIQDIEQSKPVSVSIVICSNCGEENPADSYACISCGIPLKKGKPAERVKPLEQGKKKEAIKPSGKESSGQKSLELSKLIPIFAGLIGLVVIILMASGVFDTEEEPTVHTHDSGVNLAAVQKIDELENKLQAEPGNDELLLDLAHLKNDSGFYERAIEDYRKYLERNPSNADARIDMGVCYYNLRQYDTAIQEMKKALEYTPDHQIGHLNLGIVNLAAGRLEESRSWLEKAAAIDPDNQIGLRAKELLHNH
jgi:tetratricopeptide (TPR) repeat protein